MIEQAKIDKIIPLAESDEFRVHFTCGQVSGSVLARNKDEATTKIAEEIPKLKDHLNNETELKELVGRTIEVEVPETVIESEPELEPTEPPDEPADE